MKVYTSIGSKERFFEMFQGVNKMKLNETSPNVLQTGTQLVEKAFNELKNGEASVKQTNTQTEGENNFVEIIAVDDEGNEMTFRFKLNSMESDQDDVYNVSGAILSELKIKSPTFNIDLPENMKAIQEFNAAHNGEIMDVVSQYANFETDSIDTELEEAIKLIDKVPFKKGTETMQTSKAYGDEKPTNSDVRVKSDELDMFVNEENEEENYVVVDNDFNRAHYGDMIGKTFKTPPSYAQVKKISKDSKMVDENLNSILHYSQAARDFGMLYPQAKSMGATNQHILKGALDDVGINIVDIIDVGDKYQITFEFNGETKSAKLKKNYGSAAKVRDLLKKKLGVNETEEYQKDEYTQDIPDDDVMALPPDYSLADLPNSNDDDGTKGIDPYDIEDADYNADANELNAQEQEIYSQAYDNLIAMGNQTPTSSQIDAEVLKLKREMGQEKPFKKTRAIPKEAEPFFEQLGKSIVTDMNADNAVKHGFEKTLTSEEKEQIIRVADSLLSDRLGVAKFRIPSEQYIKMVKETAINIYKIGHTGLFGVGGGMNEEETSYPEPMGSEFSTTSPYPKKKKKHTNKVKIKEAESEIPKEYWGNPESEINEEKLSEPAIEPDFNAMGIGQDDDIEKLAQDKEKAGDMLAGGLADEKLPLEFDPEQIKLGLKVEMEHTDNPMIAIEIAMDHLMEDPEYYTRKSDPEASAQDGAAKDADEMTDELLGYKPHNVADYEGGDETEEEKKEINEDMNEYQGEVGDKYQDGEGNQFTVKEKKPNGVTLQGNGGEKEIATQDIQFLKKLSEAKVEKKEVITEEQIKMARQALNKRGISDGMTKKEAVQILIKHNIK